MQAAWHASLPDDHSGTMKPVVLDEALTALLSWAQVAAAGRLCCMRV